VLGRQVSEAYPAPRVLTPGEYLGTFVKFVVRPRLKDALSRLDQWVTSGAERQVACASISWSNLFEGTGNRSTFEQACKQATALAKRAKQLKIASCPDGELTDVTVGDVLLALQALDSPHGRRNSGPDPSSREVIAAILALGAESFVRACAERAFNRVRVSITRRLEEASQRVLSMPSGKGSVTLFQFGMEVVSFLAGILVAPSAQSRARNSVLTFDAVMLFVCRHLSRPCGRR
jgi:hypothetical protein